MIMHKEVPVPPELEIETEDASTPWLHQLADAIFYPIARIFIRHSMTIPVLERRLRWNAVKAALGEPEFAVDNRDAHKQTHAHAAMLTGLSRRLVTDLDNAGKPQPVTASQAQRMIRVLAAWRTQEGFQDENGQPLTLPIAGPAPSITSLAREHGSDIPPRALADVLVASGNAEWEGRKLKHRKAPLIAQRGTVEELRVMAQFTSDFLHTLAKVGSDDCARQPRFRMTYFNDIAIEHADAALTELHAAMQTYNDECERILTRYRDMNGKQGIRLGIGMYSFQETSDLLTDDASSSADVTHH